MSRTLLLHPRTQGRCAPEISGLHAGRGDGMRGAASPKLANGCRWKRGEPKRCFAPVPTQRKKRGPENGPQNRPPSEQHAMGLVHKMDPFFLRKKSSYGFFLRSGVSTTTAARAVRVPETLHAQRQHAAPGPDAAAFAPIPGDVARRLSGTPSLLLPHPSLPPSALCPSFSLAA